MDQQTKGCLVWGLLLGAVVLGILLMMGGHPSLGWGSKTYEDYEQGERFHYQWWTMVDGHKVYVLDLIGGDQPLHLESECPKCQ